MKKIITLVLALALLMTSVVAIAETHATPNINSFATMKVKYVGAKFRSGNPNNKYKDDPTQNDNYYEITLSKPVDRLLVNWTGKGEEPEELAVDENLQATAMAWNHKYMPGTTESYVTSYTIGGVTKKLTVDEKTMLKETYLGEGATYDVETSEWVYGPIYKKYVETSPSKNANVYTLKGSVTTYPSRALELPDDFAKYPYLYTEEEIYEYIQDQIAQYEKDYGDYDYIVDPQVYYDAKGKLVVVNGSIGLYADTYSRDVDPKSIQTRYAAPDQTAFMTVQGEWAVYYNRAGKIIGIEYFEGQF